MDRKKLYMFIGIGAGCLILLIIIIAAAANGKATCESGWWADGDQCKPCPTGFICLDSDKKVCGAGKQPTLTSLATECT
jgi:hypothetical protein